MKRPYHRMFWGYVLILIDLNVGIDLLADPIGFLMIFSGLTHFSLSTFNYQWAKGIAFTLVFLTIPSMFVALPGEMESGIHYQSVWGVYAHGLSLLNVILVYFILQTCKDLLREDSNHDSELIHKTNSWFKGIMFVKVTFVLFVPFLINLPESMSLPIGVALLASHLISDLVLLVLLRHFDRSGPSNRIPGSVHEGW